MRQGKEMDSKFVIFVVISTLLVVSIYSSSYMFQVFVEGAIVGGATCTPQGGGKTRCCAVVVDEILFPDGSKGQTVDSYCTTCDNTNPPSNCTPREKQGVVVNPGKVLSNVLEGGVLEEPKTQPKLGQDVLPKGGGVLEQPENNMTFSKSNVPFPQANDSDDNTNNTLALLQSDVENDTAENNRDETDVQDQQDQSEDVEDSNEEEEE